MSREKKICRTVTVRLDAGSPRREEKTAAPDGSEFAVCREWEVVNVHTSSRFQTFEGYGTALTESACRLLAEMTDENRRDTLSAWFGGGVNGRFIRCHIDSCDFSLTEYQAVEDPIADPELTTFSISHDLREIIPTVLEASRLAGGAEVMLSPWSPPAVWKTAPGRRAHEEAVYGGAVNHALCEEPSRCNGGSLRREYYGPWAKYICKYVRAYLDAGVPVTMLTPQNEPYAETDWDTCFWTHGEMDEFISEHLVPEMKRTGLTGIGLYVWDHNKEHLFEHTDRIMSGDAADFVAGAAFHWYSGDYFDEIELVRRKYPRLKLIHSESCMLRPPEADKEESDAVAYAHDMIGDFNHGLERWIDWNIVTDERGGPRHVPGGFAAPIIIKDDGELKKLLPYEFIRLFSEVIPAGSVALGVSSFTPTVEAAAAARPDGRVGTVILNRGGEDRTVNVRIDDTVIPVAVPASALVGMIV